MAELFSPTQFAEIVEKTMDIDSTGEEEWNEFRLPLVALYQIGGQLARIADALEKLKPPPVPMTDREINAEKRRAAALQGEQ